MKIALKQSEVNKISLKLSNSTILGISFAEVVGFLGLSYVTIVHEAEKNQISIYGLHSKL